MKSIAIYRDDGLGDTLFTIPTLKILSSIFDGKIYYLNNFSNFVGNLFCNGEVILQSIDSYRETDLVIFLGPWGKIRNFKHFKKIINFPSKYKIISSYSSKLISKMYKFLFSKNFFYQKYFFIDFENIFEGHDILNTFNFILHSFLLVNNDIYEKMRVFKDEIFNFYDYRIFGDFQNKERKKIVLHWTYKSFDLGAKLEHYETLINYLQKFGDVLVVFGPYEKKYMDIDIGNVRKVFIENIMDYVELCLESFMLVGFDTGPVHLASFFNVPVVISIFPDQGFDYRVKRWAPFSNVSKIFLLKYSQLKDIEKLIIGI